MHLSHHPHPPAHSFSPPPPTPNTSPSILPHLPALDSLLPVHPALSSSQNQLSTLSASPPPPYSSIHHSSLHPTPTQFFARPPAPFPPFTTQSTQATHQSRPRAEPPHDKSAHNFRAKPPTSKTSSAYHIQILPVSRIHRPLNHISEPTQRREQSPPLYRCSHIFNAPYFYPGLPTGRLLGRLAGQVVKKLLHTIKEAL